MTGTVKNPEEGEGIVLRILEAEGKDAEFTVNFGREPDVAYEVDINEKILKPIAISGSTVKGTVAAHSFKNLLVRFET